MFLTVLGAATATQALACPHSGEARKILRDSVPLFTGDAAVLDIHARRYRREAPHGVDARVTRVAKGPAGITAVTILSTSSCDQLPRPGESGIVIGKLSRKPDGTYELWPTPELSQAARMRGERRLMKYGGVIIALLILGWLLWARVIKRETLHLDHR